MYPKSISASVIALGTMILLNPATAQSIDPTVVDPSAETASIDEYELTAKPGRKTYFVSRNQRGTTLPIPEADIIRLCGDRDGCSIRMGMHNWDNSGRIASREFLFYYNRVNRNWRSSLGDPSGTNSDNITQHANHSWACYFTDGSYSNFNNLGDPDSNFGLLSWNQYNADCTMTIID